MSAEKKDDYIIETTGLTKKFGGLIAVNNLSIRVRAGTIHGFIGPNGAGKTTTIKMLIGALRPTSGSGQIRGYRIGSLEARKVFGFSPEHPRFYDNMKAHEYLVYMGMVSGLGGKEAGEKAGELLRWLELDEFSGKKIGGFSAGMRQKLCLAQAMIHEPEILILDEPTANLDPAGRLSIIRKLRQICDQKKITIFISSHILSELEKMADEVTIISHGKMVTESGVKALEAKYAGNEYLLKTSEPENMMKSLQGKGFVHKAWLDENRTIHIVAGTDENVFRRSVAKVIASENAALEAFGMASSDLEHIFMKLVGESDQKMEKERKSMGFRLPLLGRLKRMRKVAK